MDKAEGAFRLLTINTWKGEGSYHWRMQMMARELHALEADVICLQEAVQTAGFQIDTAEYLSEILDMEMVYAPARLKKRNIEMYRFMSHSGLAILSAAPIDSHWLTRIPTSAEDPERMALNARIFRGDDPITITNLHLTHLPGMDALRHRQLQPWPMTPRLPGPASPRFLMRWPWAGCGSRACVPVSSRIPSKRSAGPESLINSRRTITSIFAVKSPTPRWKRCFIPIARIRPFVSYQSWITRRGSGNGLIWRNGGSLTGISAGPMRKPVGNQGTSGRPKAVCRKTSAICRCPCPQEEHPACQPR